jgi:hypothetical protein
MYRVDPKRLDLVKEFQANPFGKHSPELRRLLTRLRMGPAAGRYVLVRRRSDSEWVLGRLTGERGGRIEIFRDQAFTKVADGEWEIFKRRWEALTGVPIPQ